MSPRNAAEIEVPDTLQVLTGILARRGDEPALVTLGRTDSRTLGCAELAARAERLAAALATEGVAAAERVLLFAPNSAHWVIACLAILRANAVPVPVDSQATGEDLQHILATSRARLACVSENLLPRLRESAGEGAPPVIRLDGDPEAQDHYTRLSGDAPQPPRSARPGDEAVLFYTSGTSGLPKGVPLTHANLLSNLRAILAEGIVKPGDRLLLPLPLHHVYPFSLGLLAPLLLGMPLVLPHSLTGPQLKRALDMGRVTAILGIPRLYGALYAGIEQQVARLGRPAAAAFRAVLDLLAAARRRGLPAPGRVLFQPLRRRLGPQLDLLICGGAALDEALAWRLEALGWRVTTGYGLTETSPILAFNPPGTGRFDAAGRPLKGVELRTAPGPAGERAGGEVQARGANVFAGYLQQPDKTAEAFTDDGWFRTGDLGVLEDSGWLRLRGRVSARIVLSGGENIDPERLEARIEGCPSVREAGVLERDGALAALLVPEPGASRGEDEEAVAARLRREVADALRDAPSYQRPGNIRLDRSPLPRTRLGKLRRHKLAERFAALARGDAPAPRSGLAALSELAPEDRQLLEDANAGPVWSWLGKRFKGRRITPDSDLRQDLDVDSLEWVSLTMDLEGRLGIALDEETIAQVETVRDLLRASAEAGAPAQGGGADLEQRLSEPEQLLDAQQRRWLDAPSGFVLRLGNGLRGLIRGSVARRYRLRVDGVDRLPRGTDPFIMAPNHLSSLDPAVLMAALDPALLRRTYWGGWTGLLFHRPWTRLLSRALRVLPVDPSSAPLSSLAFGAAAMGRGGALVWFPEGTRSADGSLGPFRPGIGTLLRVHPVPVVPVHIQGTREALPPGRWRPRPGELRLRFGAPADPEQLEREGEGDNRAQRIADGLRRRVLALA